MLHERIPPQNIDAEQAVLGAIFLDPSTVDVVLEILQPDDFYRDNHRYIFQAIMELSQEGRPVDIISVADYLREKGRLEAAGGVAYLASLPQTVSTAANVEYHARLVEEKALLRRLIHASTVIANMAYEGSGEVDDLLDRAEGLIFEIAQRRVHGSFVPLRDVLLDAYNRIEQNYKNKGHITGVPTGFVDLDRITSGLQPSDLIIVAARPAMGKTAFCLNLAQNAAIRAGVPVGFFSLEMSREQLVQRILCSEAMVDQQKVRTGQVEEKDWLKLAGVMDILARAPIYIDDTPGISIVELRAKARRLKQMQKNLGLIIIDYLQLIQGSRRAENRQQEISEISRSLKALARELNVPVVALSQLSRAVEQRSEKNKRPQMSDLRESGSLEQDADVIMFIYRDEYYHPDTEKKSIAEIIVAKQRNGPTGVVELGFLKEYTKFVNLEKRTEG